jgi:hypothetical protein
MRLGDSDLVRLALIPSIEGYTVTAEFEGSQTVTQTMNVERPPGFDLTAVSRLDGIGFDIQPATSQRRALPAGESVTFHWSISPRQAGQQRLSVQVALLWTPVSGNDLTPRESQVFAKGLTVQVSSVLGMTTAQASSVGVIGLALGAGLSVTALVLRRDRRARTAMLTAAPNTGLVIEPHPDIRLAEAESQLLRTLFRRYSRLSIEREFRSGYSGARTLLCLPIRTDGRSDAYTIAKMGERRAIQAEFENYENFVKDTLPPITARIQEPPLTPSTAEASSMGVLRYTFIGEPGRMPLSLRESLLADPDPALLRKLFETFGPNWWLQRTPYSFRVALEYDRMLPAHLVVEPINGSVRDAIALTGATPPATAAFRLDDVVTLRDFPEVERRADGMSLSLTGQAVPGQPPLRVRVNAGPELARATPFRVVGTRDTLLRSFTVGFEGFGLPDPLDRLASIEQRTIHGARSPIHGDLNLENVLVGPGGFVWLIDFARTREGHALFDFAHLEVEIITQVIAPDLPSARDYADLLPRLAADGPVGAEPAALISAVRKMAWRCLFNPLLPVEYWLALYMASLGALKHPNLDAHQRHLLYLTAAHAAHMSGE